MPTRHGLAGVLAGFLGTYTSRYSDHAGYWLFGFIVGSGADLAIDLLREVQRTDTPTALAEHLATVKFAEQLRKGGFPPSTVREAHLHIERQPSPVKRMAGDTVRSGFDVCFRVSVTSDQGRHYERQHVVFVSPHDPRLEYRSTRGPA